jgi:hypothetical protein
MCLAERHAACRSAIDQAPFNDHYIVGTQSCGDGGGGCGNEY